VSDLFADYESLDHSFVILVPSTMSVDKPDPKLAASVVEYVVHDLSETYGGATEFESAKGAWISSVVGLVREPVIPVQVYVKEITLEVRDHIVGICKYIKATMQQEAVLLVVDGKAKFI
jgi:hypothetical protein